MDVFNGWLERVEAPGFRELYFGGKPWEEVLNNDAVGGGKESQDLQDEVLLAGFQWVPIGGVVVHVNFFGGPEASLCLFVELRQYLFRYFPEEEHGRSRTTPLHIYKRPP